MLGLFSHFLLQGNYQRYVYDKTSKWMIRAKSEGLYCDTWTRWCLTRMHRKRTGRELSERLTEMRLFLTAKVFLGWMKLKSNSCCTSSRNWICFLHEYFTYIAMSNMMGVCWCAGILGKLPSRACRAWRSEDSEATCLGETNRVT